MRQGTLWRALIVAAVIVGAIVISITQPIRLGLDLRGGTQVVLEAQDTDTIQVDDDVTARTLEVLRRRVDGLGVTEPTIQRSGDRRIIIELPGVADPDEAVAIIGRTAQLAFHPVLGSAGLPPELEGLIPPDTTAGDGTTDTTVGDGTTDTTVSEGEASAQTTTTVAETTTTSVTSTTGVTSTTLAPVDPVNQDGSLVLNDEDGQPISLGPASVTGEAVSNAVARVDPTIGWAVEVTFSDDTEWVALTAEAACAAAGDPRRRVAIVLDETIITSPQVATDVGCGVGLTGGTTLITGAYTEETANDLALLIRAGALPVPVEIVERRTVGPTLGEAAIDAGIQAALIGAALTILFLIAYYRYLGLLAALALAVYALVSLAALQGIAAVLTLPGIAGFVLAIGMAVDGNVLVFERTKEEFQGGRPLRTATREGFSKAFSAIADSNVTTLIAAALLYFFASGGVRGFGVTLSIGVLVSMFTSLVVTRVLIELSVRSKFLTSRPKLWGLEVGADLRKRIVSRGPDIVGNKKRWFTITAGASLLAVSGILIFGLTYGLDFTGGRLIEYPSEGGVDLEEVRAGLADVGFPRAVVQETGEQNISIRTRQLSEEEEAAVDEAVAAVIGTDEHIRDEFVGPTIGDEIRQRALIALALALGAQLLYLAIRFRWTFGAAAVVAMFHDLAIVVGLFAWLGKELDGVFVAALLTVIGYSVNDTVVIFDRIREERLLRPKDPFDQVANTAALETLPRTINTGLSTLFILVGLYLLGGDTLADFALALIVGVLVGTYSSVVLATPLAAYLEGRWEAPPPDTGRGSSSRPVKRPVKRPVSTSPGAPTTSSPGGAAPVPPRQRKKGR